MQRKQLNLNGQWDLWYFPEHQHAVDHPTHLRGMDQRIQAEVPGNVELALMDAGVIEDPFFGENSRQLREFEFYQWWYQRDFPIPADWEDSRYDLVLHGVDTYACIWVNGQEVGECDNMLIRHRFDITPFLKFGATNQITVCIKSPINMARQYKYDPIVGSWERRDEVLWTRKAGHMYGWDICPRLVSAGLWRPVEIVEKPATDIEQLYYWTRSIRGNRAVLGVHFQFRTDDPMLDDFSLRFTGQCGDRSFDLEWPVEFVAGKVNITVTDPLLWWPRGYGDPHLYTVRCQLLKRGDVVAERVDAIGIRTAELIRSELGGENGAFYFRINGQRVNVTGSNWVPVDALHSRDAKRIPDVVGLFDDLGCNMLRVWGGGVYEDDLLFELCDKQGIMIWQDFAFACASFPQVEDFFVKVRQEARDVIERVRNHPSLVVYCGDNEIDMMPPQEGLKPEDNRISREILPQMVHICDPYRAYVPSSPYVSSEAASKGADWSRHVPEQHLWGPRDYFKGPFYAENNANFIGEIGYHGCPNVSSLEKFISRDRLWPYDNNEWQLHSVDHWRKTNRGYDRNQLMVNQVREYFGSVPDNLGEFALASQICQAEAKKFFVEMARVAPRCSGILWWNVIDCWPQISDAVVDYFFTKKLAYHYIKRVQVPVCVVIGERQGWVHPVVVVNDTLKEARGTYKVTEYASGQTMSAGDFGVPAQSQTDLDAFQAFRGEQKLYLIEWEIAGKKYGNHYCQMSPPASLRRYRSWLGAIAAMPSAFDPAGVAK